MIKSNKFLSIAILTIPVLVSIFLFSISTLAQTTGGCASVNVGGGQSLGCHWELVNGKCTEVQGSGRNTCTPTPTSQSTTGNNTGSNDNSGAGNGQDFSLEPYGPRDFSELVNSIIKWIFNLAIPVAVIMILWAGLRMLTAAGNPTTFKKGQDILKYAVIGLVIIFIGKGFISLIKSILEMRP